jgi:4-guanidinobutyraldehyde dehydrogenase / NAD-dependent aldehyde dehydrogenase
MAAQPQISWHARARDIRPRTQAFINGKYVDARSGETFDCVSPIDGRLIAKVASTDSADVDAAVAAARVAFVKGSWSRMAPVQRKRTLLKFADLIREYSEELALLETLDMGKPISNSLRSDMRNTQNSIAWFGEAIDKVYDEIAPTNHQSLAMITREPMGVVGAIVPWNFPLLMAAWKIAPALAAGNSMVLKPSEKSPLTAIRVAELAMEAGVPEGVLNVLPGFGHTAGKALALHMDVDCVAFTGSTATGKLMLQYAGQSNLKRVWLECGGKSPNVVLADCADLDRAAAASADAIFYNQGEMCSAGSRLVVHESVRDQLLEKIAALARDYQPGDPLDAKTRLGAIVDQTQLGTVMRYIDSGKSEGARVTLGGRQVRESTGGYYVEPTIFDNVKPTMKIAREEIFGPVLSTLTFKSVEEAIEIANGVVYGLAAAVWSRDITTAHRVARALRAGTVWVNCYEASDITVPFGGFKQSGNGRDKSLHSLDKYVELKTTWVDLS